jgi:glycosyltransferase involved in cell wall biosynthesis
VILGVDAWRAVGDRTGVGRNVEHLLTAWSRQDVPFELVRIFSPAPLSGVPEHPSFRFEVLPGPAGELRWQASRLRRAASGTDVLFGQYTLPPGYRGRCVVDNLGIYRGRFAIPGWRTRVRSWHNRVSARRADVVIANSESTKADIMRYYGVDPGRIVVVWPGAAAEFRPARPGDEAATAAAVQSALGTSGVPYCLFVGKLSARRNVPALLEAFATVCTRHPDFHLLIVGPNSSGVPVDALIGRLGLDGSVRHVPFLDAASLAPLYRGAHAFVLPTEHEGFSHTIPEALASGCPVITVEHAALAEADLRRAVLVVPSPSAELLADAIELTIADPALRGELVRKGLDLARTLTWDETARRTMDVLYRVAKSGAAPSRTTRSPVSAER